MRNAITFSDLAVFTDNLAIGNKAECLRIARGFLENEVPVIDIYEQLFKESLYEIGRLWELNKISVATEHLATAVVEGIMNEIYPLMLPVKPLGRKVVLACIEHERHQVGIKMAGDVFENLGWDTLFLGPSVPNNSLLEFTRETNPDLLALSLSVYFNMTSFLDLVNKLATSFPSLPIIIGGQAFIHNSQIIKDLHPGVTYYPSLKSLEIGLSKFNRN
jgi:MerR family transcriptional regulator, light-induced transcriptional regulator